MDYQAQMDYSNAQNAFMLHNSIRVTEIGPDTATAVADVSPDSMNPRGTVHGGLFFTLADCAVSAAARSDGRKYATLSASFHYLRAAQTGPLTCIATPIKRGKTTSLFQAEIFGPDRRLLASGTFTMYCVES